MHEINHTDNLERIKNQQYYLRKKLMQVLMKTYHFFFNLLTLEGVGEKPASVSTTTEK